jgi:hypothetical protein
MRLNRTLISVVFVMILVGAACGGPEGGDGTQVPEDAGTTVPDAPPQTTAPDSAPQTTAPSDEGGETPEEPEIGEAGSFTVDGTEFAVTLLNRCIPFSDQPGNIDLQALAQGQGAKLNLVLMGGTTEVSVDGSGIQELFGSIAFGQDPAVSESTVSEDRWAGSATVGDSLGSGETVDITWDVMVPAEAQDCGL